MGCLNVNGNCCFSNKGCVHNDMLNGCTTRYWHLHYNPMPAEDAPTIGKLKMRLSKHHRAPVMIDPVGVTEQGRIYRVCVCIPLGHSIYYRLIIRPKGQYFMCEEA